MEQHDRWSRWWREEDALLAKRAASLKDPNEGELQKIDPVLRVTILRDGERAAPVENPFEPDVFEKLREEGELRAARGIPADGEIAQEVLLKAQLADILGIESLASTRTTLPPAPAAQQRSELLAAYYGRHPEEDPSVLRKRDTGAEPPPRQDWSETAYAGGKRPVDENTMGFRRANPKHASRERAEGFIDRIAGIFTARGASEEAIAEMRDRCMEMLDEADEAVLETFPEKLAAALAG